MSITVSIDPQEIAKVARRMSELGKATGNAVQMVVNRYAILIQSSAKQGLADDPRRIDEGRLRNSIQIALGQYVAAVYSNLDYSSFVHWGTGIYGENPKGGHRTTPWVYYDKKRNRFVVTRGMRSNMFLSRALNKHKAGFARDMKTAIQRAVA